MRIGILTGGGDVPGLNPCIRSVVLNASDRGWTVLGFRRGWQGLLEIDPDDPDQIWGGARIAADAAYGEIVCHCERITLGEMRDALQERRKAFMPSALQGLAIVGAAGEEQDGHEAIVGELAHFLD